MLIGGDDNNIIPLWHVFFQPLFTFVLISALPLPWRACSQATPTRGKQTD